MPAFCFLLIAIMFAFLALMFCLVAKLGGRVDRLAQSQPPPAAPALSLSAITQSSAFAEAVRCHILAMNADAAKPAVSAKGNTPKAQPAKSETPPPALAKPTERELGLLADLLSAAELRAELAGADAACTLYLQEVNRQYQQDYTRGECEALARKLVALAGPDAHPLIAGGSFFRICSLREGITAIEVNPKSAAPLRARFLS